MRFGESEAEILRREREHHYPPQSPFTGVKNYGFVASCFTISLILGLIAFAYMVIYPKIGNPSIEGTVYVVTNGKSVIKMPGVTVLIMDTQATTEQMALVSSRLRSDFPDYKARYNEAATDTDRTGIERSWWDHEDSAVAASIAGEIAKDNLGEAFHERRRNSFHAFQETKTDMEGHFAFQLPRPGDYMTVAYGERDVLGDTEHYFWLRKGQLKKFLGTYNSDLSNDSDLDVPGSHLGADSKIRLLMEHYGLQVQELDK